MPARIDDTRKDRREPAVGRDGAQGGHAVQEEGRFVTTREGHFISVSDSLALLCGFPTPRDLITANTGLRHQLFVRPLAGTRLGALVDRYGSVADFETEFRKRDGSTVRVSLTARALRDANGRAIYYEGTVENRGA